ncbi:MAG TPA: zinc-dependent metalloprotease [Chloroflexia bacterium]|nr:zinc-dependent metalloprotease [Chloroflexia bacterium]
MPPYSSPTGPRDTNPRYDPRLLGLGLLAGAALGLVWADTRRKHYARHGAPDLMDWERVRRMARQIVQEADPGREWHERWEEYYRGMVARCYPLITAEMGRPLPAPVDKIAAFSRTEWIDANIANFKQLFEPIEGIYKRVQTSNGLGTMIMSEISQTVLSTQLGVLMGYLARRVLGQYDLSLLGKEPVTAGQLYFVEPNINGVQAELDLNADDFRLWIALHETTHAYEFEAYPWVREYFNSMLEEYFEYLSDDILQIGSGIDGAKGMLDRLRSGASNGDSWIEGIMTPEQRTLFSKLQAVMSIIEGYSNYIMNAVGARLLPSYEIIKERIEQRAARRSPAEKLFVRITGLALKMEQYKLGESFINSVVEKRGIEFANKVWAGPEFLPTLEELRDSPAWISRVEQMSPAGAL